MDLPDWLAPAVAAVLDDMARPSPLRLTSEYAPENRPEYFGTLRFRSPDRESFEFEVPAVPDDGTVEELLVRIGEELPYYVSELEQSWAQSRPHCPGHTHPAAAVLREGEAWWVCPAEERPLGRIGTLVDAKRES